MPRRIRNPFGGSPSTSPSPPSTTDRPSSRRSSWSKQGRRISQLFSSSPTSNPDDDMSGAHSTGANASADNPPPPVAAISPSLPTISITTPDDQDLLTHSPTQRATMTKSDAVRQRRAEAQFGPLVSPSHLYTSQHPGGTLPEPILEAPPYYYLMTMYISYLLLIIVGHIRDFCGKKFTPKAYAHLRSQNGYAPLYSDFDNFYIRRLKTRIDDCFNRPITGVPGRFVTLLDRKSDDYNRHFTLTGTMSEALNISSYNYLGFAQSEGPCADAVENTIRSNGITVCSPRSEAGTTDLHVETEELVARFVGKEAAIVHSMGFVTNAATIPALMGKGCLIISDELNHSSIRFGARLSGSVIAMFKHNNMHDLEKLLRERIAQGQPRSHRPWKKILVAVEGLYSMEGTMVDLPGILALKRKYKFYIYLDEAHSIGAVGPHGRGVCDYFGIDPSDIDILMGTLTKSFGANGGYIAATHAIINKLRLTNAGTMYGESPSPPVLMQVMTSLRMIAGELSPGEGRERLQRIAFNSRYLRLGLKRLGFIVYGHDDSPIVPLMLYNPGKIPAFSREMLRRHIAVVVLAYPASPIEGARARFCVSAAHTKADMDMLLRACDEVGDILQLKFSSGIAGGRYPGEEFVEGAELIPRPPRWKIEDVIEHGVEDVKVVLR